MTIISNIEITKSVRSGADTDSIYTPTVYWFPLLKFLDISLTADDSISNLDELSSENYSLSKSSPEPRPSSSQCSHVASRKRRMTNCCLSSLL
ncbi:hypothetical protein evm_010062 [Chilo suppressalis]|nr:hypothetical protein evm_010062 [Chilo suppressalis]